MNLFLIVMSVPAAVAKFPAVARLDAFNANFPAAAALAEAPLPATT